MSTDTSKIVTFRLGDDLFAADIYSVERVLRYQTPTVVPNVPPWIEGVSEYQARVELEVRRAQRADAAVRHPAAPPPRSARGAARLRARVGRRTTGAGRRRA